MAAPVFTVQVFCTHGSAGEVYTVPDGFRLVTRFYTGFNSDAINPKLIHLVEGITGATILQQDIGMQSTNLGEWRVCLNAGQRIINDSDAQVDVTVVGYLLTLP
jgi:hypothetical protein